ncbi:MAG: terminase [Pelagibacteraceae bacterium]|nr:terminase [Pelagibacteraceae bacterium]
MSSIDDKLNEVLNIVPEVFTETTEISAVEERTELVVPQDKDAEVDFDKGRENLYKLLDKGNDAIDGILALAKEGEHPRAYEVAGQLIKTVADMSKDLMAMQEKLKKLKEVPNTGPTSVTNALFVGSTTELTKLLKEKK